MRLPIPALLTLSLLPLLAACDKDDPIVINPPPPKTASITVVEGTNAIRVGEVRTFTASFVVDGVETIEWDLDFDGTTFTVDRSLVPPVEGQEPVTVYVGEAGTQTVALRGVYAGAVLSEVATVALEVLPSADATRFRPTQRELGDLTWDPASAMHVGPYSNMVAGNQALGRNGNRLLAGYWSLKPGGVVQYYLVASNDLGSNWGVATKLSEDAADRPFLDKTPEVAVAAMGDGFLIAWITTAGQVAVAGVQVPDAPKPVPVRGVPQVASVFSGQTTGVMPSLVANPTNPQLVHVLLSAGTAAAPNSVLGQLDVTGNAGEIATAVVGAAVDSPYIIGAISGVWANGLAAALELVEVTPNGGFGGGVTVSRDLALVTSPFDLDVVVSLAHQEGAPLSVSPYKPSVAAGGGRVLLAFIDEGEAVALPGAYNGAGDITLESSAPIAGSGGTAEVAVAAVTGGFQLLYARATDPAPTDPFQRHGQILAALLSADGVPIYVDEAVDRDDPNRTDSHGNPTVIAGPNGEALAVWVGTNRGRNSWGRFSYNRTG